MERRLESCPAPAGNEERRGIETRRGMVSIFYKALKCRDNIKTSRREDQQQEGERRTYMKETTGVDVVGTHTTVIENQNVSNITVVHSAECQSAHYHLENFAAGLHFP